MNFQKIKYNGKWYPTPNANIFKANSNTYAGIPNLASYAGDGEIALTLIDIGRSNSFALNLASSGSYNVDFGDNTSYTINAPAYTTQFNANSMTAQVTHTYDPNNPSGKGIWIEELQMWAYVVRIYNASSAIKYFKVARDTSIAGEQHSGVVDAYLNLSSLVDISNMWSNGVSTNPLRALNLKKAYLKSAENVIHTDYFAYECSDFEFYNFPVMPLCTSRIYAFFGSNVYGVTTDGLYSGASSCSMSNWMNNSHLIKMTFTGTWASISNTSYSFGSCNLLSRITLPNGVGNDKLTNCDSMFSGDNNLIEIINVEYLGSRTSNCSMNNTFDGLESYVGALNINAKLTKFTAKGTSNAPNKITSIRFLNTTSPWSGTSPQCDLSYSGLNGTAVNQVFTDLVASGKFSGKVVKVTGLSGYDSSIITNAGGTVAV